MAGRKPSPAQEHYRTVYLRSEHWKTVSAAARARADHRCEECGHGGRLDVHHLTYERLGAEDPADLRALCRTCHDRAHHLAPRVPQPRKPKPSDYERALRRVEEQRAAFDRKIRGPAPRTNQHLRDSFKGRTLM